LLYAKYVERKGEWERMEVYNCPRCGDGSPYICQKCYDELSKENKQLRDTLLEISQLPQYGNQLDIDRLQEAITLATDTLEGGRESDNTQS